MFIKYYDEIRLNEESEIFTSERIENIGRNKIYRGKGWNEMVQGNIGDRRSILYRTIQFWDNCMGRKRKSKRNKEKIKMP